MSAYAIAYIRRVHDRKALEAYWATVGPTFAGTGAKPISVYAPFQHVECEGPVEGVVLVEFPNAEAAQLLHVRIRLYAPGMCSGPEKRTPYKMWRR